VNQYAVSQAQSLAWFSVTPDGAASASYACEPNGSLPADRVPHVPARRASETIGVFEDCDAQFFTVQVATAIDPIRRLAQVSFILRPPFELVRVPDTFRPGLRQADGEETVLAIGERRCGYRTEADVDIDNALCGVSPEAQRALFFEDRFAVGAKPS